MVEEQSAGGQDISEFKEKISKEVMSTCKFWPDYPKKGVTFMDLFSITTNPPLMKKVIDALKFMIEIEVGRPGEAFNYLVGLEARGFVLGPILAMHYNLPFTPIRKGGKLPGPVHSITYNLEYKDAEVCEIQAGVLNSDSKVLLIDDLLATGGTLAAAMSLIDKCEGA